MEICPCLYYSLIGCAVVSMACGSLSLLRFLKAIYAYKLRRVLCGDCPKEIRRIVEYQRTHPNKLYALVTGATDGIGLAYAKALASFGVNVIVVGRNAEKIDNAMKVVSEGNNVEVRSLKVDFNDLDQSKLYKYIADSTQDLDIVMLVNNVGVAYPYPMDLTEVSDDLCNQILNVNVRSAVEMCRIFIPRMRKLCIELTKCRPIIINISSIGAIITSSNYAIYGASKSFLTGFSRAIADENPNIIIQCVMPGLVSTKMTGMNKSFLGILPDEFIQQALSSLGILNESFGCLSHHIQAKMVMLLLPSLYDRILKKLLDSSLEATTKSQLKKTD